MKLQIYISMWVCISLEAFVQLRMSSYYEQKSVEEEALEAVRQHAEEALNEGDTEPRR